MQTDTVFAFQVEEGDFIVLDLEGEVAAEVAVKEDIEDSIILDLLDDSGEKYPIRFGPFDSVTIATVLDEDVEFEDVPID